MDTSRHWMGPAQQKSLLSWENWLYLWKVFQHWSKVGVCFCVIFILSISSLSHSYESATLFDITVSLKRWRHEKSNVFWTPLGNYRTFVDECWKRREAALRVGLPSAHMVHLTLPCLKNLLVTFVFCFILFVMIWQKKMLQHNFPTKNMFRGFVST